ncbi:unnamed protein product [Danaus chrysippus]|uniref:(African queen) hypothetical protein n=1 Tax=Danaus chrysippus TaxID=151541 RepID=A0A8J2QSM2_9NEOP|nr:unnamed protein product [Danaus chrysippus]
MEEGFISGCDLWITSLQAHFLYGDTVSNCVHLQLYKDLKERQKSGQTKASLSLQQYLGFESGFTLDKESNTLAILCEDVVPVLAFDTREMLMQWRVKVQHNLGSSKEFAAVIISSPTVKPGPVRLHACGPRLALCGSRPPEVLALWDIKLLRRFGMVDKRFCVEGGSRCGRGEGLFVFAAEGGRELTELLNVYTHEAHSRLSIASRSGSVLEKRFSDTSSCMDDCFNQSLRSVSPAWPAPTSHTMHCLSDLDSSLDSNDDKFRRPTSLPRCSSCVGKISHLTRSSTMNTPGSMMSPVWTMDNIIEKRSDSDRASIYSRSSGSASEYSVPRSACMLDKSFENKRGSPVAGCTPTVPVKTGCTCWQQTRTCCCKKKTFNGPYENYDVPKTPMPLIKEHPVDSTDAASLYDTPKKLKCLTGQCSCSHNDNKEEQTHAHTDDTNTNYVNVTPQQDIDLSNYANIDKATLEEFESSLRILRSAGFSQEELDALEDIPEHDDKQRATSECCNNMEHTENSSCSNSKHSDNISRISHVSDNTQQTSSDNTISTRRASSADFTKRYDDEDRLTRACYTPTVIRRSFRTDNINDTHTNTNIEKDKTQAKTENVTLVTKLRDAVKIRRSSSVPSKSDKNRDSSSSNDSGVSTGSLKHHKGDFELDTTKSSKKTKNKFRNTLTPVHAPLKCNASDPLKHLTFQFEEVSTMTYNDGHTLTNTKKRNGEGDAVRHSHLTKSSSSGASDTSDYMESLSVSSFSSCDVSERHVTRPRSGKEYATIDRSVITSHT